MPRDGGLAPSYDLVEVGTSWPCDWLLAPGDISVWAIGIRVLSVWIRDHRKRRIHVYIKRVNRVAVAASHAHADASKNERNEGEKTQQSEGNLPRSLVGEATVQKAVAQIAIIYWPWLWLCQK